MKKFFLNLLLLLVPLLAFSSNCSDINITTSSSNISITGLDAPVVQVQVFDLQNGWQLVLNCAGDCNTPTENVTDLAAGDYLVKVSYYDASWTPICVEEQTVTVTVGDTPPPPTDCTGTSTPLITFDYDDCDSNTELFEFSADVDPNSCLSISNISTRSLYSNSPPHPYPNNNFPGQDFACGDSPTGSAISLFQDTYGPNYSDVAGSFHSVEFRVDSPNCDAPGAIQGFEINADIIEYADGAPTKWFLRVLRNSLQVYVNEDISIASLDNFQGHFEDFAGNADFSLDSGGAAFTTFRFDFMPYAEDGSDPWNALSIDYIKIHTSPLGDNDSDNDGVCDDQDCQPNNPNIPATPGTTCDDGDANTTADVIQANGCDCAGVVVGSGISLNCPADILLDPVPGNLVTFTWPLPTGSTDCSTGGLSITQIGGPSIGTQLLANNGTYEITYEATDACGNSTQCSFNVTEQFFVADIEFTSCPSDINVNASSASGTVVNWEDPVLETNCPEGGAILQSTGLPNGSTFPLGTTEVVFQGIGNGVGNGCGVSTVCIFNVTVTEGNGGGGDTDCSTVNVTTGSNSIAVSGLYAPNVQLQIFDLQNGWQLVTNCLGDCNVPTETANNLAEGEYLVKATFYDENWTTVCLWEEIIYVGADCNSLGGDSDNDGTCDADDCQPNDPFYPATPGAPCDDGDDSNFNDIVTADGCGCQGDQNQGPDCNTINVTTGNGSITVGGLMAPVVAVRLIDLATQEFVYSCIDNCTLPTVNITGLAAGDYQLRVSFSENDGSDANPLDGTPICGLIEIFNITTDGSNPCDGQGSDSDNDGVCDNEDCQPSNPNFPAIPGTTCNDDNPITTGDIITADGCGCEGIADGGGADCFSINRTAGANSITVSGLDAPIVQLQIFDLQNGWNLVRDCAGDCNVPVETVNNLAAGDYLVKITFYNANWVSVCVSEEVITVTDDGGNPCDDFGGDMDNDGVCDGEDCQPNNPFYPNTPGTICDDANDMTSNDVVQADGCSCAGTTVDVDACDLDYTLGFQSITFADIPSTVTVKLIKVGIVWKCGPDTNIPCPPSTTVSLAPGSYLLSVFNNDCINDSSVSIAGDCNDIDNDGVCDEDDCHPNDVAFPDFPGEPCDDGDLVTVDDVISADGCSCAGTPSGLGVDCFDVDIMTNGSSISVTGLDAPIVQVEIFDEQNNSQSIFNCNGDCDLPTVTATGMADGDYLVRVTKYNGNLLTICTWEEIATVVSDGSGVDLSLAINGDGANVNPYSDFSVGVILTNEGTQAASNIVVNIPQPQNVVFQGGNSFVATQGDYDPLSTFNWNVGTLGAGESATLALNYFSLAGAPYTVYAQVQAMTGVDMDSTPGNGTAPNPNEDDEAVYVTDGSTSPGGGGSNPCPAGLAISVNDIICDSNGTSNNTADDTFTFDLTVEGGSPWGWSGGGQSGTYGQAEAFGPYNINAGTVNITVVDNENNNCTGSFSVDPPSSCSDGNGNGGGGTPTNDCDDISITSSGSNISLTGVAAGPLTAVWIYDLNDNWNLVFDCSYECNATETIPVDNGLYRVIIKRMMSDWTVICELSEDVTINQFVSDEAELRDADMSSELVNTDFSVYPNPSSDFVNINLSNVTAKTIIVNLTDRLGRSVYLQNTSMDTFNKQLDLSQHAAGVYFMTIQLDNELPVTKQVVLMK